MYLNIDFEKLEKCHRVNEDEQIARELVNLCSSVEGLNLKKLEKVLPHIRAKHFIIAKKILKDKDKKTLNSMVTFEYLVQNVMNTPLFESEDEFIYV